MRCLHPLPFRHASTSTAPRQPVRKTSRPKQPQAYLAGLTPASHPPREFDPRRELPSRPPNRAAATPRARQAWPRLRGHPLDPMLVDGWSGDSISFPTIQPQRIKMLHLDGTDAPDASEYATVCLVFELSKGQMEARGDAARLAENEPVHDCGRRRDGAGGAIDGSTQQSLPRRPAGAHHPRKQLRAGSWPGRRNGLGRTNKLTREDAAML
jgi:hypothetical protein